jgi:hypothetical protein
MSGNSVLARLAPLRTTSARSGSRRTSLPMIITETEMAMSIISLGIDRWVVVSCGRLCWLCARAGDAGLRGLLR